MRRRTALQRHAVRVAAAAGIVIAVTLSQAGVGCAVQPDPGYNPVAPELLTVRFAEDNKVLAPAKGLYSGVFESEVAAKTGQLDVYAVKFSKKPAIAMWYQAWTPTGTYGLFKKTEVESILKRGAIPMITWEPWIPGGDPKSPGNPANQPAWRLSRITAGDYDPYVRAWARGAASVDGPIMLRPMHEMNGYWYPWSGMANGNKPEQFVAAWKHIHDIFIEEGATNVTWVWSINWNSSPNTAENHYSAYYPGAEYVDWTSISGFNWGTSPNDSRNHSFDHIYTGPLAYLRTLKKPIVISEIACNTGVDKPAWIRDAYRRVVGDHPEVKGIVYFNKREVGATATQNWPIYTSAASEEAYRYSISSRMFIGGAPKSLLGTGSVTP